MERQQLQDYIEQLTGYINNTEVSEEGRQALQGLIDNIELELKEGDDAFQVETLAEQVDELATMFEMQHPTLTAVLHNIIVTLTSMGV